MPMTFGEMSKTKTDNHDKERPVMERSLLKYICTLKSETFIGEKSKQNYLERKSFERE